MNHTFVSNRVCPDLHKGFKGDQLCTVPQWSKTCLSMHNDPDSIISDKNEAHDHQSHKIRCKQAFGKFCKNRKSLI